VTVLCWCRGQRAHDTEGAENKTIAELGAYNRPPTISTFS
jgi:hypothetical protein